MASTPNFNWSTPDNTGLVKNGALDIRTLGNSIDASLVDLKGGTTGQLLSKASGTDMDFTWTSPNPGDITEVTAGTGLTGGGTSGAVTLNIDPAYAGFTNLNYIPNPVLNSAMQVWQRGTSIASSTTAYAPDRWQAYRSVAGATVSRQATNDTTNLPFIQYAARVQRDSGNTSSADILLSQTFESLNSIPFVGKTVTLSYYARAGANYSAASNALSTTLITGTGTDLNALTSFTGALLPINTSATLTTTWQRFTFSATLSATATQIGVYVKSVPVGTAGANDWFEITGVQLDIGSVALPFRTYAGTIQGELAAAQRYYVRWNGGGPLSTMTYYTSTLGYPVVNFPVEMRIAPTAIGTSSTGAITTFVNGSSRTSTNVTFNASTNKHVNIGVTTSAATAGQAGGCDLSASAWLEVSAEL